MNQVDTCPWCFFPEVSISGGNCPKCGNELDLDPEEWAARKPLSERNIAHAA